MEQKAKQYALIGVGVAALIFSLAAWAYIDAYSKSIQPSSFRSFSVSGEGKVISVPDVAKFTFSVITQGGKNLGELQKKNVGLMNEAIAYVKDQGVAEKDIKTEGFNVEPRYQYYACREGACPPAEIVGYTVSQTVGVKVRDFDKAGDILSGVVSHGANNVSGLQFTIDDPSIVMAKAREQAIQKAKEKAEQIADAGGFSLGRLLGISEGGYQPMYDNYLRNAKVMNMSESSAGGAPAPSIEAGSQDVSVSISLQYEIK
ncbi:MAG: hypothetical protein LiPW41_580 [Parcubacteria group bacterium LiPW_41]|nr:MAG: hypothetical protein LiPW41_580 [Parcubacteria group bacterium LiPW_41]